MADQEGDRGRTGRLRHWPQAAEPDKKSYSLPGAWKRPKLDPEIFAAYSGHEGPIGSLRWSQPCWILGEMHQYCFFLPRASNSSSRSILAAALTWPPISPFLHCQPHPSIPTWTLLKEFTKAPSQSAGHCALKSVGIHISITEKLLNAEFWFSLCGFPKYPCHKVSWELEIDKALQTSWNPCCRKDTLRGFFKKKIFKAKLFHVPSQYNCKSIIQWHKEKSAAFCCHCR